MGKNRRVFSYILVAPNRSKFQQGKERDSRVASLVGSCDCWFTSDHGDFPHAIFFRAMIMTEKATELSHFDS